MASAISHAVAAVGIGACFYQPDMPKRILVAGVLCSIFPDIDALGFHFGIAYGDFWGHRGFTHSLAFAPLLAAAAVPLAFNSSVVGASRLSVWSYLFLAAASHGLLDAMTDGGLGVALFSPFDNQRYFLPWTPIHVSPIGISRFFSSRGVAVLQNEFVWIWLPSIAVLLAAVLVRHRFASR
jgi:inner membrane protein